MRNKIHYIASPYSHHDSKKMEKRYLEVTKFAAKLTAKGFIVFSPITHCHVMAMLQKMPHDWDFWANIDFTFLDVCESLIVLQLPGWESSVGVTAEITYARNRGKRIMYCKSWYDFKKQVEVI